MYTIKVYQCYCLTREFTVNNIDANVADFGMKDDITPECAMKYGGCGNMTFSRFDEGLGDKEEIEACLAKYRITQDEFDSICDELEEKLSFHCCDLCS